MDQSFRLLCPVEARRLLLLIGVTVAVVTVVQYLEVPSIIVLTSLFSAGNSRESSSNPETTANWTLPSGLSLVNASEAHETTNSSEASNVQKEIAEGNDSKHSYPAESNAGSSNILEAVSPGTTSDERVEQNKSFSSINGKDSVKGPVAERAVAPTTFFKNVTGNVASISEKIGSPDSYVTLPPSASGAAVTLPPIASPPLSLLWNESFPQDKEIRSPITFMDSNISTMSKEAAGGPNQDKNSGLLQSNYSESSISSSTSRAPTGKGKKSIKPPSRVVSISQMNHLLQQSHASSSLARPSRPSQVDKEMQFARSEIEKTSGLKNDTGLYAPIYRDVSMFKRSYELMEIMLKVYIYQEGEKPIFHEQILDGIYASEGWFMRLMEANENFVTTDPSKAHLFYIPFSSRLLELTLYKRKSHSRQNLIQYMKDYVDMIAAKYSFWNRTGGADHFVAACHDWAPAETRGRMLNSIRALCNADIEVGFSIGKDVSLPETYVHSAKNPLKNLEGNPPSQRPILAFFAGNLHGYVRPILLDYWENKDPDMKIFGPLPHVKRNANYIQYMKSSKYCICPRGHEVNSPRIVESIFYECIPVIISDNYVPPFFEVLDWESFAVFVLERDIPNLKNILLSISEEMYVEMHKRVKIVQQHFLWHTNPVKYDLFYMILHSVWYNRVFR